MGSGISRFSTAGWFVAGGTGALGTEVDAVSRIGATSRRPAEPIGRSRRRVVLGAVDRGTRHVRVADGTAVRRRLRRRPTSCERPARIVDDTSTERFALDQHHDRDDQCDGDGDLEPGACSSGGWLHRCRRAQWYWSRMIDSVSRSRVSLMSSACSTSTPGTSAISSTVARCSFDSSPKRSTTAKASAGVTRGTRASSLQPAGRSRRVAVEPAARVAAGDGGVVGGHELDLVVDLAVHLVELQAQQPGVDAQFDDHRLELGGDAVHHVAALHHRGDVADGGDVLELVGGERAERVVEPGLVPLERLQRLVGAVEQAADVLQLVLGAAGVHADDAHLLAGADDRHLQRASDTLGGAVTGAGLAGGHGGVGHQVHVGPGDARAVGAEDDRAVHLGQLGHALRAVRRVEQESAAADGQHVGTVADDDQARPSSPGRRDRARREVVGPERRRRARRATRRRPGRGSSCSESREPPRPAAASASVTVETRSRVMPVDTVGRVGGHDGPREPEPRRLGEPAPGLADLADLARQPDLAEHGHVGRQRRARRWR